MRILRFSHDYLLNVGGLMVNVRGLNRELGRCGMEVDHAFLIGQDDISTILRRGRIRKVGDGYVQQDAMVNLFPCVVPNRSPTIPDGDSPDALRTFERDFSRLLKVRKPDVVHVHLVKHAAQCRALELASELKIPTVMSHHEGFPETLMADEFMQRGAAIADLRFSITKHASLAFKSRPVDYIGFYIDTVFWHPQRVLNEDISKWKDFISAKGQTDFVYVYPARFIRRKNHHVLVEAVRLMKQRLGCTGGPAFKVILVGETIPRHTDYRQDLEDLVREYSLLNEIWFLDVLDREQLRALLALTDAVVYPAFNEGAGRSHLEGMLMGNCAIVANDAGLMEYIRPGETGLAFSPDSPNSLMEQMLWVLQQPDKVATIARAGRDIASTLTLNQHALDHIRLYEKLLSDKTCSPAPDTHEEDTQQRTGSTQDRPDPWSFDRSVLVLDLDYCLIRPRPIRFDMPSAFPLEVYSTFRLSAERGREYEIRGGLADLEKILRQPWHARMVVSMSTQEKVSEVCNTIQIGGKPLAEWMDVCIGKEVLKLFAEKSGLVLPLYADKSFHNPFGRTVRTKPVQIALIKDLRGLRELITCGEIVGGRVERLMAVRDDDLKVVWLDDQEGFTEHNKNILLCPILQFNAVEDYASLIPVRPNYSVAHFNTLDFLWRAINRPFGLVRYLLSCENDWSTLRQCINVEMEILKALPGAENDRQFHWLKDGSWGRRHYGEYRLTVQESEAAAALMRVKEHLKLYCHLAGQKVTQDLTSGNNVLFLGRDMDYAFHVARHLFPEAIESRRLASLPLSRDCIAQSQPETIVSLLLSTFPTLARSSLTVYDVGYHGHILTALSNALENDARTQGVHISGFLLNTCGCKPQRTGSGCSGTRLELEGECGTYVADRALGISIERMPHTTGAVTHVSPSLNGFRFSYESHTDSETVHAEQLTQHLDQLLVLLTDWPPAANDIFDLIARLAAANLRRFHKPLVSYLRRLIAVGDTNLKRDHHLDTGPTIITLADHDLHSLLLTLSGVSRVVIIDSLPAAWKPDQIDFSLASEALVELIVRFSTRSMEASAGKDDAATITAAHTLSVDGHVAAFVSLLPCLGYLGISEMTVINDFTAIVHAGSKVLSWNLLGDTIFRDFLYVDKGTAATKEVLMQIAEFDPTCSRVSMLAGWSNNATAIQRRAVHEEHPVQQDNQQELAGTHQSQGEPWPT